jgi:hypothetical protein
MSKKDSNRDQVRGFQPGNIRTNSHQPAKGQSQTKVQAQASKIPPKPTKR